MEPSSTFLTRLQSLAPIDLIGLGVVAVLVVLGLWRGLWWQVIRLLGVVLAVALARIFSPETALWLNESWPDLPGRLTHGIAWGGIFLLTLGAASILGLLGQKILEAMKLGLVDRLGGAMVGAVTGIVVHLALLVLLCQLGPETFVAKHVSGSYSDELLDRVGSRWRIVLGAEASAEVDRLLGREPLAGERTPAPSQSLPEGAVGSEAATQER